MNIAIIYGSVRSDRQGIKAAKFIQTQLEARNNSTTLIDPKKYALPMLDKMHKEYAKGEAPKQLEEIHNIFQNADGFVVVSAEYNHLPPPALLNLMDYFQSEYHFKPSAIVSYSAGAFAGIRAAMALRQFLAELGTPSIPSLFPIGKVQEFGDDGTPSSDYYIKRVTTFLDEFEWYVKTYKTGRENNPPQ